MKIDLLRSAIVAAVVVMISFSIAPATPPCDCFYYPNHERAFRESQAVFIGEVTKVERHAEPPEDLDTQVTYAITFKVIKSWKGPKGQVRTWEGGMHTMCAGWKFEEGDKYLIYAESHNGVLVINGYCSRTRRIETKDAGALKEFAELNNPQFLRDARKSYRDLYGTWRIVSYRFGEGISVGPDDARKLLGLKIVFGSERAESGESVCELPTYQSKRIDADQFLREFKTSLKSLGIKRSAIELLNVQCYDEDWPAPGSTLLIVDKGRMLTMWDGVFFDMKKVSK